MVVPFVALVVVIAIVIVYVVMQARHKDRGNR